VTVAAVGGFVADELAAGLVVDVPDGRVGAGVGKQAAEFVNGVGDVFAFADGVVGSGFDDPHPHPLHPPTVAHAFERLSSG
jgi:hypothetical protein